MMKGMRFQLHFQNHLEGCRSENHDLNFHLTFCSATLMVCLLLRVFEILTFSMRMVTVISEENFEKTPAPTHRRIHDYLFSN